MDKKEALMFSSWGLYAALAFVALCVSARGCNEADRKFEADVAAKGCSYVSGNVLCGENRK